MNNINITKNIRTIFIVFTLILFLITLSACRESLGLPKPIGRKISLTTSQLEERLSKLSIPLNFEDILYSEVNHVYLSGNVDNPRTSTSHSITTYNKINTDLWLTSSNKVTFEESIYEVNLNGYQSTAATYIDITDTMNQPFSEDYEYMSDHIDGKYQLYRTYPVWTPDSINLTDVVMSLGVDILISTEFLFDENMLEFVKNLHRLNFPGLAFYEHDVNFSITLDFKVVNYDEYSADVIDYIKEYYSIGPSHDEYLDFKLVMNFKENRLIEMGHIRKAGYQIDNGYFAQIEFKINQNIVDSLPSEIIYEEYELIDSIEAIKINE